MSNSALFSIVSLIWGTTWIAITFQLGEIHPVLSVAIRFSLAAAILGVFCVVKGLSLRLPKHLHIKMAAAGLCFYGLEYSLLYLSQQYIISALVALMSSGMIYINVLLRRVILKKPIRMEVVIGAAFGMFGIGLIFYPEFSQLKADTLLVFGITLALASFLFAGLGNVLSERILDYGTPVVQMNFWAMSYGSIGILAFALVSDIDWVLPTRWEYYLAISYLSIFGSVIAFGAYMKLVRQMGSDKTAYVVLVYPIVALLVSTIFEGYQWYLASLIGVFFVILGNAIAMGKLSIKRTPAAI
ncbi:DMT family transporter [Paraglaciecola sp. L1A13]|uniref:DMT family transporter n=1 Tax=Paraglaciecola sp. L1A13 TaxID=2686359 RepID=UPI00131A6F5B|nr:DMT family transporter [Paraglaciecola sp. L1A13]